MTVKEALKLGTEILMKSGIEAPVREAGAMLCHVLNWDKSRMYAYNDVALNQSDAGKYMQCIGKRAEGVPLQYITGHQEFMSLDFLVNENVLIPRHDTETLVETALAYAKEKGTTNPAILDIGTGSGCIAVSLAYYLTGSRVTAVDISPKALESAASNAIKNNVADRINFVSGSLFDLLGCSKFDIIVSNPPYIPVSEVDGLQREVSRHEPLSALDGGEDGLDFYREIISRSPAYIKPGGLLAFEVGYNQAEAVSALMRNSYKDIKLVKDLAGIDRVVAGINFR